MFTATIDARALDRQLSRLSQRDQFAVARYALQRATTSMRKEAGAITQRELTLKKGSINKSIAAIRFTRRSAAVVGGVRIVARRTLLSEFRGTRATKRRGVSVQVKRRGGRRYIRTAFKARVRIGSQAQPAGFQSIFRRKRSGAGQVARFPIETLFSTSVRQTLDDPRSMRQILEAGRDRFVPEYRRELRRRLGAR